MSAIDLFGGTIVAGYDPDDQILPCGLSFNELKEELEVNVEYRLRSMILITACLQDMAFTALAILGTAEASKGAPECLHGLKNMAMRVIR
jgi:hypothetical protein